MVKRLLAIFFTIITPLLAKPCIFITNNQPPILIGFSNNLYFQNPEKPKQNSCTVVFFLNESGFHKSTYQNLINIKKNLLMFAASFNELPLKEVPLSIRTTPEKLIKEFLTQIKLKQPQVIHASKSLSTIICQKKLVNRINRNRKIAQLINCSGTTYFIPAWSAKLSISSSVPQKKVQRSWLTIEQNNLDFPFILEANISAKKLQIYTARRAWVVKNGNKKIQQLIVTRKLWNTMKQQTSKNRIELVSRLKPKENIQLPAKVQITLLKNNQLVTQTTWTLYSSSLNQWVENTKFFVVLGVLLTITLLLFRSLIIKKSSKYHQNNSEYSWLIGSKWTQLKGALNWIVRFKKGKLQRRYWFIAKTIAKMDDQSISISSQKKIDLKIKEYPNDIRLLLTIKNIDPPQNNS